jgi:DNA-directed RNA polymerase subunit RPC12/RpoP
MYQYITAHCGKMINISSEDELDYEKLRCPDCNKLIRED